MYNKRENEQKSVPQSSKIDTGATNQKNKSNNIMSI